MDILQIISSNVPATQSVSYSCVLTNKWSGATHPVEYPSGTAHWTAPVLVSHSSDYEVWSPFTLASPGVEAVAEGGVTSVLQGEVTAAQIERKAGELVIAWPGQVRNFNPMDTAQDYWYQSFKIATYPWDAGTEQGETYSTNNEPETPHRPILQLTKDTVPASGIFLDPTRTKVLPVALWTCNLDSTSGGTRGLLKEEAPPSEAPIGDTRGLLSQEAPATKAPCGRGARSLLSQEAPPTEAPCGPGTRGLLSQEAPATKAPCGRGTRGLLSQEAPPTEAPCGRGTRGLLSQEAPPTEAPCGGGTRSLLSQEAPSTEAPCGRGTRGLRGRTSN